MMHGTPEDHVARAFEAFLSRIGLHAVRIDPEEVVLGRHRTWRELHMHIAYRVDPDDAGFPNLEFYAYDPMGDDHHGRIWADGHVEELDAMRLWFHFNPEVMESKEAARQELFAHNLGVGQHLRRRGLLPDTDDGPYSKIP